MEIIVYVVGQDHSCESLCHMIRMCRMLKSFFDSIHTCIHMCENNPVVSSSYNDAASCVAYPGEILAHTPPHEFLSLPRRQQLRALIALEDLVEDGLFDPCTRSEFYPLSILSSPTSQTSMIIPHTT